jgi:hypothetical protein
LAPIRWKKASFIKLAGPSIEKMRTKGIHWTRYQSEAKEWSELTLALVMSNKHNLDQTLDRPKSNMRI